jgi:hypothetical protein
MVDPTAFTDPENWTGGWYELGPWSWGSAVMSAWITPFVCCGERPAIKCAGRRFSYSVNPSWVRSPESGRSPSFTSASANSRMSAAMDALCPVGEGRICHGRARTSIRYAPGIPASACR